MMTKQIPFLIALLLSACTVVRGSDFERRRADGNLSATERYHESVLAQLGDAWNERGLERMKELLGQSRGGAAPEQIWRYERFESMYQDAWIHLRGFARMGFYIKGDGGQDFTMGERNRVVLQIVPSDGHSGRIKAQGQDGQRTTLFLELRIVDVLADGSRTKGSTPIRLPLREDIVFSGDKPFELEIPLIQEPNPDVYIRSVRLRGELFWAEMDYDDTTMQTGRFELAKCEFTRYPKGFRKIRAEPLKTLANALKASARYRGHILVCAHFLHRDGSKKDIEQALDLILGTLPSAPAQAESALLYSLQILVPKGEGGPLARDRDGWLRWANTRER